jgi:hypothetical protein
MADSDLDDTVRDYAIGSDIDARRSQGFVNQPTGPITQNFVTHYFSLAATPAISSQDRRDRRTLVDLVRQSWIAGVLHQSLWAKARLDLPMIDRPGAVQRPYGLHERGPEGDHPLPAGTADRRCLYPQRRRAAYPWRTRRRQDHPAS